jgi:hypothetical protein
MQDSPLVTAVASVVEPLLQLKFPGVNIVQKYQGTSQAPPTEACVFMFKVSDHRSGSARIDYAFDTLPENALPGNRMATNTVQVIESRWQFSAQWPTTGDDPAPSTASDLLRYVAMLLSVDGILQSVRKLGINPMRITDVTNPYHVNDYDQFAAHPTFDVILQHYDNYEIPVPRVVAVETEVHAV